MSTTTRWPQLQVINYYILCTCRCSFTTNSLCTRASQYSNHEPTAWKCKHMFNLCDLSYLICFSTHLNIWEVGVRNSDKLLRGEVQRAHNSKKRATTTTKIISKSSVTQGSPTSAIDIRGGNHSLTKSKVNVRARSYGIGVKIPDSPLFFRLCYCKRQEFLSASIWRLFHFFFHLPSTHHDEKDPKWLKKNERVQQRSARNQRAS